MTNLNPREGGLLNGCKAELAGKGGCLPTFQTCRSVTSIFALFLKGGGCVSLGLKDASLAAAWVVASFYLKVSEKSRG